jgi:hydroxymethylglutaryl-CoA lyase
MKGLELAQAAGARDIAVFAAASESFTRKNINATIDESLARYAEVCAAALVSGMRVRGYVSTVIGCPYEGDIAPMRVASVAKRLSDMGCYEVSLGDTIGVGTPARVHAMLDAVLSELPLDRVAVHFHDTYGQALANIYASLERGVATVDSSVGGLGGCPYARGASGNVASEDVLYLLNGLGIATGVDLGALVQTGAFICAALGRESQSKAGKALLAKAQ